MPTATWVDRLITLVLTTADIKHMAELIDQADSRRPAEVPRMGERYEIDGLLATWFIPKSFGRTSATKVRLLDVSVAGALVEAPLSKHLQVGSRITWELNGLRGAIEIRNVREVDGIGHYGVSYFSLSSELGELINKVVKKVKQSHSETR